MGFKVFRTSIAWSRIFPRGDEEKPNQKGIEFYHNLFAECRKYGIEPLVTLSHYETPLYLAEKYDGWRSRKMIDFYKTYVKAVFEEYKDEVKYWLTFNEINSILESPFMSGAIMTPKDELTEEQLYQAAHHELTASAWAVKIGHKINPDFKIGCMILSVPVYPLTPEPDDVLAAKEQEHKSLMFAVPCQAFLYWLWYAFRARPKFRSGVRHIPAVLLPRAWLPVLYWQSGKNRSPYK